MRAHVVWTYDDYRTLPDHGKRYEVIEGELITSLSPTTTHQRTSGRLLRVLMEQLEDTGRGVVFDAPTDVIFSKTNVAVPDHEQPGRSGPLYQGDRSAALDEVGGDLEVRRIMFGATGRDVQQALAVRVGGYRGTRMERAHVTAWPDVDDQQRRLAADRLRYA